MIKARVQLIQLLGAKCKVCGEDDIETLQIDHISNDAADDRRRFKNMTEMYVYYLNHPEEANEKIQVLCSNHNWKKRYVIHTEKKILEQQKQNEIEKPNKFFDWEQIDDIDTPLWKEDHLWESPPKLGCPNCHISNWSILVAYGIRNNFFEKVKKQHLYLVCNKCHFDILCDTGMARKPSHIKTAETDYYHSLSSKGVVISS